MIYPIPGGGLLGERPVVPEGREKTEREEQLQRQIEGDAAQGPVVKAKEAPSAPSLDEWDGHLAAGHAEYRGWCPFCVVGKERVKFIDGLKHHETMDIRNFIWITLSWAEKPRTERHQFWWQVLKRSLADHTPCAVQRYSASRDHRKACERCDHEWCANPGGEVRSGGVDC